MLIYITGNHYITEKSPDDFTGHFYQTFKELTAIFLKLIQKLEEKETFPNSFYEASITLMPKPKTPREEKTISQDPL